MSTKKINFNFEIEHSAKLLSVRVYGLKKSKPVLLFSETLEQSFFQIELLAKKIRNYYIVIRPLNSKTKNVYISTFTKNDDLVGINEYTTIASTYAFNKFTTISKKGKVRIALSKDRFSICQGMKNNFVSTNGHISKVITSSPNGLETNSFPMFNSLATILDYCQQDKGIYLKFIQLCAVGDKLPSSTLGALLNLTRDTFHNARKIYDLVKDKRQTFIPSLRTIKLHRKQQRVPDHWSLSIKVNRSGAQNFLISGPGYIDFDKNNRVWVTNNTRQGTPNSSSFCVVLNSDGSPADFSPVFGGGLLGGGFGVTVNNKKNKVFLGNYGWGPVQCNPQKGSISVISAKGKLLSPSNGYTNKLSRVQGMKFDSKGNLWMCSWGTQDPMPPSPDTVFRYSGKRSSVVVYLKGDPNKAISYDFSSPHYMTFDLIIDKEDNVYVSNSGDGDHKIRSSIYKLRLENDEIVRVKRWRSKYHNTKKDTYGYETFRQICLNSKGDVFVGGIASNRILQFNKQLKLQKVYTKNIDAPWGVTIDGADTIYSANFIQEETFDNSKARSHGFGGPFGVTIIKNERDKASRFLNLPSGGAEVKLANGLPIYGNTARVEQDKKGAAKVTKCYNPLSRMTGTRIDKVGNLWAINNWKPAAAVDLKQNPGGDGLVIFIGLAVPNTN